MKQRSHLSIVLIVGLVSALIPATATLAADPVVINELQVSTAGTDWEFVELQGTAGTDLSGYALLAVESDGDAASGTIDFVLSTSGTIPADGLWLAASSEAEDAYGVTGDAAFPTNSFENSTTTYLLVTGFSGAEGDDLDTDDDGVLDSTPWDAVHDSVNLSDSDPGDFDYGAVRVGPDGGFLPSGTFRCPDGPSGTFADNFHDFASPNGTPGTSNTQCSTGPQPPQELAIHDVQGPGAASPFDGQEVVVDGVVVGVFLGNDFAGEQLGGFNVQEESGDQDTNPDTSEGIFVFAPDAEVSEGDVVRVSGTVDEFFGLTEITDVTDIEVTGSAPVTPAAASLPVDTTSDWETLEGMLVTFEQDLVISEYFNYDRFGEIVLTASRQFQPTQMAEPGSAEAEAMAAANALSRITLDDTRTSQNPDPAIHPNGEEFTLTNTFRGGDILRDLTGVVDFSFDLYRIQPTQGAAYVEANPRPTSPEPLDGKLRVASFNVLNFFTHIDNGSDICGPTANLECRGADTAEELQRQLDKLVAGIIALDADIVGIQEIENDILTSDGNRAHDPVLTLVEALNADEGAGTWAWVGEANHYNDYPVRNEIIYRTDTVRLDGPPVALADAAFDRVRPGDIEPVGRPPLAQTFRKNRGPQRPFTVVVNHFKSKGSSCADIGDPDAGDGQGNCNLTRVAQAEALLDFIEVLEERSSGIIAVGDFNSYAREDPIDTLKAGGLTNLAERSEGEDAYSYVFDGQLGTLDYIFVTRSLLSRVRGSTIFHINADEPDILDYDTTFKQDAQDALYEPEPYRVSDHDPAIVGLTFRGRR